MVWAWPPDSQGVGRKVRSMATVELWSKAPPGKALASASRPLACAPAMAATTHYDLLITATSSDAFVRARTLLWSINATVLKALSMTEARAEELMRHLATPPARPWLLAHRYSEQAWA